MNCPDCGEHVFGHKCGCGWYEKPQVRETRYQGPPIPTQTAEWEAHKNAAMQAVRTKHGGYRDWAYKIIEKHRNGEPVNLVALKNAQQAVRYDPNGGTA